MLHRPKGWWVVRLGPVWLWAAALLSVEGCVRPAPESVDGGQSVSIELEQATIRQYRQGEQVLLIQAPLVRLQERSQTLEAPDGVRARLEPRAWEESKR